MPTPSGALLERPCTTCAHVGVFRWRRTCAVLGHHPRTERTGRTDSADRSLLTD